MLRSLLMFTIALLLSGCYERDVSLPGYIDNEVAKLATSGSGVVKSLLVKRGDKVDEGAVLVELESTELAQQVLLTEAQLFQVQSELKDYIDGSDTEDIKQVQAELDMVVLDHALADKHLARLESLKTKQYVSDTAWDEAHNAEAVLRVRQNQVKAKLAKLEDPLRSARIASLQAVVQAARAKFNLAKWNLDQQRIVARESGVVDDVYFKLGEFVAPGQSVVALRANADPELIFYVPYAYLPRVSIGSEVAVSCVSCPDVSRAVVRYIAHEPEFTPPIVYGGEFNSKYVYQVRASFKQQTNLHPGQAVDITIS
mgnify:CR=1 FL=1